MARRKIPVVGSKGLHVAQLSPEVRRILAHRSRKAARREYAPVLRADRAAFGAANRNYRTEARSVRGATNMVQNSLDQVLGSLGWSACRRATRSSPLSPGNLKSVSTRS